MELVFTAQEITSDFTMHRYIWEYEQAVDQQARVSITFAPMDGQIPSSLTLSRENPKNAERPFRTSIDFTLVAE